MTSDNDFSSWSNVPPAKDITSEYFYAEADKLIKAIGKKEPQCFIVGSYIYTMLIEEMGESEYKGIPIEVDFVCHHTSISIKV
jgi:hypothetical protein